MSSESNVGTHGTVDNRWIPLESNPVVGIHLYIMIDHDGAIVTGVQHGKHPTSSNRSLTAIYRSGQKRRGWSPT